MSSATSRYQYPALFPGQQSIRLLRLLPSKDESAPIRCQLFNYSLQESGRRTHPYDALSYVWGDPNETRPIFINGNNLLVTLNLHKALSRLRHFSIEQIIWADAICINQEKIEEKEQQILFMAEIYGQANRVVVWLGEAADNSCQALDEIRLAGGNMPTNSSNKEATEKAILALLQRPWFRRIWVLQEVAAARHIVMICGPTEVDGYAFCLGVDLLEGFRETHADLQNLIRSVTYLIRGAIFRPKGLGMVSQSIRPLGELIDMYHTHEASKRHDKVYALLGMSSDDLSLANLSPDYRVPWEELFHRIVEYLLGRKISAKTWGDKEIAIIESKLYILGTVSLERGDTTWDGRQGKVVSGNFWTNPRYREEWYGHWNFQVSAKSVRERDIICFLEGASEPTIIRLYKGHCIIILIAASPPQTVRKGSEDVEWSKYLRLDKFPTVPNIQVVWDWENSPENFQSLGEYERSEACLDKANRLWNYALLLSHVGDDKGAKERVLEAMKSYQIVFEKEPLLMISNGFSLDNLDDLDIFYSLCGLTPLSWAAGAGLETVVEFLLRLDKIDVNLKDKDGRTPLSWAAAGGHLAVVKRMLQEKAEVNAVAGYYHGRTALQAAAEGGHLAVVQLLLQEKAEVNAAAAAIHGKMALQAAAGGGHLAVVQQLLQENAEVNAFSVNYNGTALQAAAEGGHLAVVQLLLREKAEVNAAAASHNGRTALQAAAEGGHLAVVQLLLQEKAEVNAAVGVDSGRTALQAAAGGGHLAVVERLLQEKAEVNAAPAISGRTALQAAAEGGHLAVVERLLKEKAKVNAAAQLHNGKTALQAAAGGGHLAVVERLLQEKAEVNAAAAAVYGRTALQAAAGGGHLAVVERLLQEKAEVNAAVTADFGRTALHAAEEGGHLAVVERLLQAGAKHY